MTVRRSRSSCGEPGAAERRRASGVHALAVRRELPPVLDVPVPDRADGAHAEPDQVGAGLRRVTLEVAVQRALPPRPRELVVGPREVVHADVLEPGVGEALERGQEDRELRRLVGQVRLEHALVLLHPRDVRVGVDGEAVRPDLEDAVDRRREALGRLVRQAVDEVDVDAREPQRARRADEVPRGLEGLDAVDRGLDLGIEVLHAHAQAVEPQRRERLEVPRRRHARVDLDADLRVRRELEALPDAAAETGQQLRREVRRRAAAQVELDDLSAAARCGSESARPAAAGSSRCAAQSISRSIVAR